MISSDDNPEPQGLLRSSVSHHHHHHIIIIIIIIFQFVEGQKVLFENHAIAVRHLFPSLLMIFIDIEHTGDSMEFGR